MIVNSGQIAPRTGVYVCVCGSGRKRVEPPWLFWRVGLLVSNRLVVGSSGSVGRLEFCRRDVAEMGV